MAKRHVSYRLSPQALDLIGRLKEKYGISEASVLEMAVRRMARVDLSEGKWPPSAILDAAAKLLGEG